MWRCFYPVFLGLVLQKSKEMPWVPKGAVSSRHPQRDISNRGKCACAERTEFLNGTGP